MRNTGVNLELEKLHRSEEDWVFGIGEPLKCITNIPEAVRVLYLPKGEVQRGLEDFMDCSTRSGINALETKFNWLIKNKKLNPISENWLVDKGYIDEGGQITFSDRFIAIKSNTTPMGNSLIAPLKAIHKYGLIPKKTLPASESMTFAEYHDKTKITPEMEKLGAEFIRRFPINFEIVYEKDLDKNLENDMFTGAGYAWPEPVNGIYPRTDNQPNHAWMTYARKYYAFDNYFDSVDGDFIKCLAPDFNFLDYGYRVVISAENVVPTEVVLSLWERIIMFLKNIFK